MSLQGNFRFGVRREMIQLMIETGFYLGTMGRYQQAQVVFTGLCEIIPDYEVPKLGLAQIELAQGNLQKAEQIYKSILDKSPTSLNALNGLGELLVCQNKTKEATQFLNRVAQADRAGEAGRMARGVLKLLRTTFLARKEDSE